MSPRPYWKGYLKLSLVSCPIAVHAACSSAERVSFRQINRKTGNRLRQQLIDEETREVVEAHEKARGSRSAKASISSSKMRSWRRSRSRARTLSTSIALCSVRRSTSASSMRPITLPPTIRSGRTPLR